MAEKGKPKAGPANPEDAAKVHDRSDKFQVPKGGIRWTTPPPGTKTDG